MQANLVQVTAQTLKTWLICKRIPPQTHTHTTAGSGVALVAFPVSARWSCLTAVSAHPRRYTDTQTAASPCRPTVCTQQTNQPGWIRLKKKERNKPSTKKPQTNQPNNPPTKNPQIRIHSLLLTTWPQAAWLHAPCLCLAYQQHCKSL